MWVACIYVEASTVTGEEKLCRPDPSAYRTRKTPHVNPILYRDAVKADLTRPMIEPATLRGSYLRPSNTLPRRYKSWPCSARQYKCVTTLYPVTCVSSFAMSLVHSIVGFLVVLFSIAYQSVILAILSR